MTNEVLNHLNRRLDHTLLRPDATADDINLLCEQAREYDFCSVIVNPCRVAIARDLLVGTETAVGTVCGFPLGANRTDIKVAEAIRAVSDGAREIDMVANIGYFVAGEFTRAETEIREVRQALPYNVVLKVIIEASLLSEENQRRAARSVALAGAQFVKTSTGFRGGATAEQVRALVEGGEGKIEVKAAGGIRTVRQCEELLRAGASRLGSSASVDIMEELARVKAQS